MAKYKAVKKSGYSTYHIYKRLCGIWWQVDYLIDESRIEERIKRDILKYKPNPKIVKHYETACSGIAVIQKA